MVAQESIDPQQEPPRDSAHSPVTRPRKDPASESRLPWKRTLFAIVAIAAAASGAYYYARFVAPFETTDNASIEGHVTPIASQVPGRVARLLIQDNQEVKQGDVLLEIDPSDYVVRLAQARAGLAAARSHFEEANAQLAVAQSATEQARAGVTATEAEAGRAEADLKRYQSVEIRAVSRSAVDMAETQARSASAQVEVARAKWLGAEAQTGLAKAGIQTAQAEIQQSEAAVRQAELNLSYTKVTAPEDGRVTRRTVEQGAYMQPGQALLAIVSHQLWVVANFKETQLELMRPGQPVQIRVDAYPGHRFTGKVESIQSGAGARFSLFPPENATGNFIKVVQRVSVKIVFDTPPDPSLVLGPGMSVEPAVRVK